MSVPDHGPLMNGVDWTIFAVASVFLLLRLYCKTILHRGLWWDDHFLIISWVCFAISLALTSYAIHLGFGRPAATLDPANNEALTLAGSILQAFFGIISAACSKTSFALTILRISRGWLKKILWFIIISMNALMLTNALCLFFACTPLQKEWNPDLPGTCWDSSVTINLGIASGAYGATMDFTLAMLPWGLLWNLQMKQKEKIGVAVAMSIGVLAGATGVAKCVQLSSLSSVDFSYDSAGLTICGTAEMGMTIVAASIPVLRVLFRDFKSSYDHSNSRSAGQVLSKSNHQSRSTARNSTFHKANITITTINGANKATKEDQRSEDEYPLTDLHHSGQIGGSSSPCAGTIVRMDEVHVNFSTKSEAESVDSGHDRW